jgi:hypothetical protein
MRFVSLSLPCLILALTGCSNYNAPKTAVPTPVPTPLTATPMFSVAAGTYTSTQTVAISDATAGADIYYTSNGTAPTVSSTHYTAPIMVSSTETLMAAAIAPGYALSAVESDSYTIAPTPAPPQAPSGTVRHGQVPIAGAHVYLLAADTTGYGNASVSLLEPALTGASDAIGAYVTTGSDGSFAIGGDYTCIPNTQVYLYALGGDSGTGENPASGLMVVLGNCPSSGGFSFPSTFVVNEATTIAAAFAMSGFATDATHVSSSGTPLAQIGIANAFANAANLANISTGATMTISASGGTVPQSEINTLADILAACVSTPGNPCSALFEQSTADGTASGTQPTDTAAAAINMAHHPGVNVAALYALSAASSAFTPVLTTQPNDFTVALNFAVPSEAAYFISPFGAHPIAIDGDGSVWITNPNPNSVLKFSPSGAMLSPAAGYTGGGLNSPTSIAIDESGNAWITDFNAVTELSNTGVALSPSNGFLPGNVLLGQTIAIDAAGNAWLPYGDGVVNLSSAGSIIASTTNQPGAGVGIGGIAVDENGDIWKSLPYPTTSGANGLIIFSEFSSSGADVNPPTFGQYSCGVFVGYEQQPEGVAIDAMGNIWITAAAGIQKEASSPIPTCSGTGGGFSTAPEGQGGDIAIDGDGNVWVVSEGQIGNRLSEFSNAGAPISPSTGYRGSVGVPDNIALDGSGNLWVAGASENVNTGASSYSLFEFIGVSAPVVTPIAAGVKNKTLGSRP